MLAGPASNSSLVGSPSAPQAFDSSLPVPPPIQAGIFVRMHRVERSKDLQFHARLDRWINVSVRLPAMLCTTSQTRCEADAVTEQVGP